MRWPIARTLTISARLDAPIGRVWQVWSDPLQLERWWGPPIHADGNPSPEPTALIRVALSELAGGTQMDITVTWASDEAMEQMLATGMDAGMTAAVGQIDELLGLPARA